MTVEVKPPAHVKVFIGSSAEKIAYAEAIANSLDHDAECEIWTDSFSPSSDTIGALIDKLVWADFGVFIFSADDTVNVRGGDFLSTRDNVLFELGIFMGGLGRYRAIAVLDRSVKNLRRPSDLLGFTMLGYDSTKSNPVNATRAASSTIKQVIRIYKEKSISNECQVEKDLWISEIVLRIVEETK